MDERDPNQPIRMAAQLYVGVNESLHDAYELRERAEIALLRAIQSNYNKPLTIDGYTFHRVPARLGLSPSQRRKWRAGMRNGAFHQFHLADKLRVVYPKRQRVAA